MMHVTVAYAIQECQVEIPVQVEASSTVLMAITCSGLLEKFPEISLASTKIGIYSQLVSKETIVHDGDRIELYRQLQIDPKQARILRAERSRSGVKRK